MILPPLTRGVDASQLMESGLNSSFVVSCLLLFFIATVSRLVSRKACVTIVTGGTAADTTGRGGASRCGFVRVTWTSWWSGYDTEHPSGCIN